jgi:hypothetical protein
MLIPNTRTPWRPPSGEVKWSWEVSGGWLPADIGGNEPVIRWMNVGSASLSEPFFQGSVGRLRGEGSNELETELLALGSGTAHLPQVAPAGIVFNMSRCGSTLIINSLRRAENVVALSEAQPVERIIGWTASRSAYWVKTAGALLTPLTTVFAHHQGEPAKNVVIKTATGAIAALRSLRKWWPDVPCVVLTRNPVEILVSNVQKPPQWLRAAYDDNKIDDLFGGLFGRPPENVMASGITEICAWAIDRYCAEALGALDNGCRVVDYEDLSIETVVKIAEYFGLTFTSEGLGELQEVFQFDSKRPKRRFNSDRETKQAGATELIRKAADRWPSASYDELRQLSYDGWRGRK